jgi:hypothetical protein
VGRPVAANIYFCGFLRILSLILSELYGYSRPVANFPIKKEVSLHRPVFIPQQTVNCRASKILYANKFSKRCTTYFLVLHWTRAVRHKKVQIMQSSKHFSYCLPLRYKYISYHHALKRIQTIYFFPVVPKEIKY